jgi:50S ribosomal subunit-associated GTPase HflX
MAELNDHVTTERELRARIAELEALVEARGLTIVGLAAQLAEFQGSPTFARGRLAEAERQLAALEATKIIRYSAIPRRAYTKLRRAVHRG